MVTHELQTAAGTPHPILVAPRVIDAIRARNEELAAVEHEWVGPESYFLGEVHGGDFYNRYPVECRLRRDAPLGAGEHAGAGGGGLSGAAGADRGGVRLRDRPRPAARARRLRDRSRAPARGRAPRGVPGRHGDELPLTGVKLVADGAIFNAAGIPTVYHGPMGTGAHGDVESIDVAELVRATAGLSRAAGASLGLSYEQLYGGFRWQVPAHVNLGVDVCERHPRDAVAIVVTDGREVTRRVTLRRALRRLEPARERAAGSRDRRGRSRRDRAAAAARDGGRARRRLQAGRDRGAALDALRAGRDGGAARRRGSGGRARRPRARGRGDDRRRPRAARAAGGRVRSVRAGGDRGRRAGADRLHVGHDRAAEGRAARPSRSATATCRGSSSRTTSSRSRTT